MSESPFLIVGLGNKGKEYANNRHNIGFMMADSLIKKHAISGMKVQGKAIIYIGKVADKKVIVAKPQTYMNLSGDSVKALVNFYKIPLEQILVIHDDLDLPWGLLRMRPEGGAGGQNGIRSIIERLGTNIFSRLKIGIDRPPGRMDAAAYVLQDLSSFQRDELPSIAEKSIEAIETWIEYGIQEAMNRHNNK